MSEEQAPTPEQSPDPITADSVVSEGHEAPSAPDSSVLNQRVQKMVGGAPKPAPEPEVSPAIQELRKLLQPEPEPEMTVETLKSEVESLRSEITERQENERTQQASQEITRWVESNSAEYPVLNDLGFAAIVAERALNERRMTGNFPDVAKTASDVERELIQMAERVAPKLGYTKSEQAVSSDENKEEPINVNTNGLTISEPPDRANMTIEERKAYVMEQMGWRQT